MHTWIYLWFLSYCINIWFIWIVGNPSTTTSRPLRLSSPKTPTSRAYRVEGMGRNGWPKRLTVVDGSCDFFWVEILRLLFLRNLLGIEIYMFKWFESHWDFDSLPYKEGFHHTKVCCGWFLLFCSALILALNPGTHSVVEKNGLVSPIVRLRCSWLLVVGCLTGEVLLFFWGGCWKRWIALTTGYVVKWWSRLGYSENMTMESFVGEMLDFYHSLFVGTWWTLWVGHAALLRKSLCIFN